MTEEGEAVRDPETGLCVRCKVEKNKKMIENDYLWYIIIKGRRAWWICGNHPTASPSPRVHRLLWQVDNIFRSYLAKDILQRIVDNVHKTWFSNNFWQLKLFLWRDATEKKILRNVWSKGDLCFRSGDILVNRTYQLDAINRINSISMRWSSEFIY